MFLCFSVLVFGRCSRDHIGAAGVALVWVTSSSHSFGPEPDGDEKASEYRRMKPKPAKSRGLGVPSAAAAPTNAPTAANVTSSACRTGSSWGCVIGVCSVGWAYAYPSHRKAFQF